MNEPEHTLLGGFAFLVLAAVAGFLLFNEAPVQIAAIMSWVWGLSLLVSIHDEFDRYASRIGCFLTYILSWAGWIFAFYGAYNILVYDGELPSTSFGELALALVGIGLPEGVSPIQAGILILVITSTYFQICATLSIKYWRFIDSTAYD